MSQENHRIGALAEASNPGDNFILSLTLMKSELSM